MYRACCYDDSSAHIAAETCVVTSRLRHCQLLGFLGCSPNAPALQTSSCYGSFLLCVLLRLMLLDLLLRCVMICGLSAVSVNPTELLCCLNFGEISIGCWFSGLHRSVKHLLSGTHSWLLFSAACRLIVLLYRVQGP
jgi:hypothetical protein